MQTDHNQLLTDDSLIKEVIMPIRAVLFSKVLRSILSGIDIYILLYVQQLVSITETLKGFHLVCSLPKYDEGTSVI